MSALTLFPARIRFTNPDGTLTPEALRMLELLVNRVGGTVGDLGDDVFAPGEPAGGAAFEPVIQTPEQAAPPETLTQQPTTEPSTHELIIQQPPTRADQVEGLGTMAAQNVGTNFTGSFTGKTVTVSNGIITQVV